MTPGLQRGPPFPEKATKGAVVAIASLETPSVPMVVGTCEIDVSTLGNVQGMKGHAVQTFHWAGDELWSWSSVGKPGTEPPDTLEGWNDEDADTVLATRTADIDLQDDQEGGVTLNADLSERSDAEKAQGSEGDDPPSLSDAVEVVDEKDLSQKGMRAYARLVQSSLHEANSAQRSTTLSETHFSMVCAITWTTIGITLHSVLSSPCRNPTLCLCLSNHFYRLTPQQGSHLCRSRRQAGRILRSSSNTWISSRS